MDIKEKIKGLPQSSGVYIMKDKSGVILYVGKANNLKKRVAQYFHPGRRLEARIAAMTRSVEDINYIPAVTEAEALIYENSLIKQLSPKYNVALRDDKSYPMLKLTVNDRFPRLLITREKKADGSIYYGPYANPKLLREALAILRALFPLRTCARIPKRVCLNYHIRQCLAPCEEKADEAVYGQTVSELRLFLERGKEGLIKFLADKMKAASKAEDFEEAERVRKRIEALSAIKSEAVAYGPRNEVEELGKILGLASAPQAIEAFDVSNIMGQEAVGSMIYFYRGRPRNSEYRRFKIKMVSGIDDYAMIREVVRRRYLRLLDEHRPLPDLVLIDGGKGHLGVALDELERLGAGYLPVVSIAKEFEHIYIKGGKDPIVLPKESKALRLLERIRDEAHRFAITYHKKLLSKAIRASELDNVPGIGVKRKRALLSSFGSVDSIKKAGLEELLKVEGVDERSARNIIDYFQE